MKINVLPSSDTEDASENRHTGQFGVGDGGKGEGQKRYIKSKFSKKRALSEEGEKVNDG
jgi:hypothetical protein